MEKLTATGKNVLVVLVFNTQSLPGMHWPEPLFQTLLQFFSDRVSRHSGTELSFFKHSVIPFNRPATFDSAAQASRVTRF
jgi:hypothetical protein